MPSPREELLVLLRTLNLGGIRAQSRTPLLLELARIERAAKHARRIERLRKQSELLLEKTYRSLELNRFDAATRIQIERLRGGAFLAEAINVVAVGRPCAGKSHVACALGHASIEQGHPVLFAPTSTLVQRLLAAKRDLRLPQQLAKLDRFEGVILDDIGGALHAAGRTLRAQERLDHEPISCSRSGSASSRTR